MTRSEFPIISVRPLGSVTKDADGRGFSVPVEYRTANRLLVTDFVGRSRKRDVLPAVASMDEQAKDGCVQAVFSDDGFIGTKITFDLTGRQ